MSSYFNMVHPLHDLHFYVTTFAQSERAFDTGLANIFLSLLVNFVDQSVAKFILVFSLFVRFSMNGQQFFGFN